MRNTLTSNNRLADSPQAVSTSLHSTLLRGVFLLSLSAMACADPNMPQERTLMLAAASHLEQGNSREADRILTNLRKLKLQMLKV